MFFSADSSELIAVRVISASRAKKTFDSYFLDMMYVVFHENIFFSRFERAIGCYTDFSLLSPKPFDSYFLGMMYVEFMKNFFVPHSSELMASELMAFRVIAASRAQKHLIPTF